MHTPEALPCSMCARFLWHKISPSHHHLLELCVQGTNLQILRRKARRVVENKQNEHSVSHCEEQRPNPFDESCSFWLFPTARSMFLVKICRFVLSKSDYNERVHKRHGKVSGVRLSDSEVGVGERAHLAFQCNQVRRKRTLSQRDTD